jgi:hypothetical protein
MDDNTVKVVLESLVAIEGIFNFFLEDFNKKT